MTDDLFRYYESELFFIRKLAQEFAAKHPAAASRLRLEPTRSADPHVERLIEAFALLAARVRNKLDDEFPELTDALLSVVYPHALAPVPSLATVQFDVHPAHAKPDGVRVPAGSPMHSVARTGDLYCKFRTCYPLTVWPLTVAEAKLHPPPFPPGLNPPAQANAALRLRLRGTAELPIAGLNLDTLRVHLLGEPAVIAPLYDLLFNHALEVAFVDPDNPRRGVSFPAAEVLRPVGFEPGDGLLPYADTVFPGYRLLTEYFAYPAKFLYVDIAKLAEVRAATGAKGELEVVIFLDRSHPRLEQMTKPDLFRLGCVPMANLFEVDAEPIQLTHAKSEYKIVPLLGQDLGHEVYSVVEVNAAGARGNPREYLPFYQFRHGGDRTTRRAFWHTTRRPALAADDRGTDVYLHLVDAAFHPATATDDAVVVRAVCTNRDLPVKLPRVADAVRFEAGFAAAGLTVKCVRNPTPALRPAGPRGRFWHLISHLNLNHLSLADDGGLDALTGLLRLYDLTDPEAEPQAAALARQSIEGVVGVGHRRAVAWLGGGDTGGLVRGVEIDLQLDEGKFVGSSGVLFASVLERFFALSVSVNSFSRLVAKYRQRDGILKRWPPRAGDRPLV